MESMVGGEGPLCMAVLWSLTFVVLIFLALRAYTRIVCVAAYGIDDHLYVLSWVLMAGYSAFITVAAVNGYGRDDLTPAENATATYWRMVSQSFALTAVGTAKASVGFFLLRLAVVRWQRISITAIMSTMGFLAFINVLFTWVACKPLAYAYDETIGGTCFNTIPTAVMMAGGTILVDLYFAVLPWIFIWKLNIPRKEKFVIAGSMSLGVLAAAAGIIRVFAVKGVRDVPVAVIVWSQVEGALTLICVGIPVCRPLWTRYISKWWQSRQESSYIRQNEPTDQSDPVGLETIGGGTMPGAKRSQTSNKKRWPSTMTSTMATKDGGDAQSDEVDLTGDGGRSQGFAQESEARDDSPDSHALQGSWVRGGSMTRSTAEAYKPRKGTEDDGPPGSGIRMQRTYDISRGD
ncbi:hypothetical protein F5X68DRAFT_232290 [Plectosphaerella plurivora]|uniref:Rhodopsin domain-containing protein n=1 Tax=Plectosphaerella plurivora TaxID=936078 RepID=A0A9P8VCD8_9PEZI|nr:hypothetical protein F5X68DRAFT_232290 [Plectosphaerella plurivora]